MAHAISLRTFAHTPAARRGQQQSRTLLAAIRRHNRRLIERGGDIDVIGTAELIAAKLILPDGQRVGLILGLAEFIACALDGAPLDPAQWQPLTFVAA